MPTFHYVYILVAVHGPARHYVGLTTDLRCRVDAHNDGRVPHSADHQPWRFGAAIAVRSSGKARAFERYLKSHSGRTFARNHY